MLDEANVDTEQLVPVEVDGNTLYLAVRDVPDGNPYGTGAERPIVARERRLDEVLDSIAGFGNQVATRLKFTDASKVTVQFSCEVMVESGSFVAVIGKASAKSTVTVCLEWDSRKP